MSNYSKNKRINKYLEQFNPEKWLQELSKLNDQERTENILFILSRNYHNLLEPTLSFLIENDKKWIRPLLHQSYYEGDANIRLKVIKVLRQKNDIQSIEIFINALEDKQWKIRRHAALSLGKLKAENAVTKLIHMLKDKDWRIRRASCDALSKMNKSELSPILLQVADDKDWRVRRGALRALEAKHDPENIEKIINKLHDKDWRVRILSAELLGSYSQPHVWKALIGVLDDSAIESKVSQSLLKMGVIVIPDLNHALLNANTSIARAVSIILGEIGDNESIEVLKKALNHKDLQVKHQAQQSLELISKRIKG